MKRTFSLILIILVFTSNGAFASVEENSKELEILTWSAQLEYLEYQIYYHEVKELDTVGKFVTTKTGTDYIVFDEETSLKLRLQKELVPIQLYNDYLLHLDEIKVLVNQELLETLEKNQENMKLEDDLQVAREIEELMVVNYHEILELEKLGKTVPSKVKSAFFQLEKATANRKIIEIQLTQVEEDPIDLPELSLEAEQVYLDTAMELRYEIIDSKRELEELNFEKSINEADALQLANRIAIKEIELEQEKLKIQEEIHVLYQEVLFAEKVKADAFEEQENEQQAQLAYEIALLKLQMASNIGYQLP